MVQLKSVEVSTPHGTGRMIRPADLGMGVLSKLERAVYKLHSLYTLFTETLIVQSLKRVREIGMGQEGLHCQRL